MEGYLLSGNSQFIITSISFLLASGQAAYLNRLDDFMRDPKNIDKQKRQRVLGTYRWLLFGWWLIVLAAFGGAVRILLQLIPFQSNWFDGAVVVTLIGAYVCLSWVAGRTWKWGGGMAEQSH